MKKSNNKGFMLAETLAVTVVVMIIFVAIYANFMPTRGEYERRIEFNNVPSQYATFYMRKIYLNEEFTIPDNGYVTLYNGTNCNNLTGEKKTLCNNLAKSLGIEEMIIANYNLTSTFKNNYHGSLDEYISYLPVYPSNDWKDEEGWSTTPCSGATCEFKKQYRSKNLIEGTYNEWGNWTTTACVVGDKCETARIYRSRTSNTVYGDYSNYTISSCTPSDVCKVTDGYLKQNGTKNTPTCVDATCSKYNYTYTCLEGDTVEGETCSTNLREYESEEECNNSCESDFGDAYTSLSCKNNVCYNTYEATKERGNCETYSCDGLGTLNSDNKCCPDATITWDSGSYVANCTSSELVKCTSTTLYQTRSKEEVYDEWSAWDTTSCTGDNLHCEERNGYRTRTKNPDTYGDIWSEWTSTNCMSQPSGSCEARTLYRDTRDLYRLIIKTKHGYANTALKVRLTNDKKGPVCTFTNPNVSSIINGEEAVYILNCTDTSGFDTTTKDLKNNSFELLDSLDHVLNNVTLTVGSPTYDKKTYTYKYNLKVTTTAGVTTADNVKIRLKERQIFDTFDNYNGIVDSKLLTINNS